MEVKVALVLVQKAENVGENSEPFSLLSADEFCVFWNSAGFSCRAAVKRLLKFLFL